MTEHRDQSLEAYRVYASGRRYQPFINLIAVLLVMVPGRHWPLAPWWALAVAGAQGLELAFCNPSRWKASVSVTRIYVAYALVALTVVVFSPVCLILWKYAGTVGAAAAMIPMFYALMSGTIASRGQLPAFLAEGVSSIVMMLLLPVAVYFLTSPDPLLLLLFFGELLVASGAVSAFRWMARVSRMELEAKQSLTEGRRRAEAATEAKSAFVAMVSHELRTPISAIVASAHDLEATASAGVARSNAQLIVNACGMLRTLLNDLLDFSKIEAGKMSVETIAYDPRTLVFETLKLWRAEARKKGVRLRLTGGRALPAWVMGDPMRLRQILNNLLSNAAKFTDCGAITLAIKAKPDGAMLFRVTDTGPGMSADQLGRLFTPFDQLSADAARMHGGTGLGLSISRNLARLMQGDLSAASRPGEGASFTLRLPLPAVAAPVVQEPVSVGALGAGEAGLRLLIVDDHKINRLAIETMLRPLGADLTQAQDGETALAIAKAQPFDVILMDVRMPGLSGLEATRLLRDGAGPNRVTPVIAVTGDGSVAEVSACHGAGMTGHVLKPIEPARLYAAIMDALAPPAEGLALAS
jgi:signal transduction histidine kinase/ActR/RegA family two-component response regulator